MRTAITQQPQQPLVISYARFSVLRQSSGDSMRRQLEASKEWAAKRGLTISDAYKDEGVSAYKGKNAITGALSRIISLVEGKQIPKGSILIVESLDRLSRSQLLEALQLFLRLLSSGITVVTLSDGYEYSKDKYDLQQLLYSLMIMSRANEESAIKGKRSLANWQQKTDRLRRGEKGVILTGSVPSWLRINGKAVELIPAKAALVKQLFALCIQGYGIGIITRKFNREGIPNIARGERWHSTTIHDILTNPACCGEFIPRRYSATPQPPILNYYPAVVDRQTFDAANAMLAQRRTRKYGGSNGKQVNIFNGLMYDEQNEPYTFYGKRQYHSFVSLGALLGKTPHQINLRVTVFEGMFFDVMLSHFREAVLIGKADSDNGTEINTLSQRILSIDAKIDAIQAQVLSTDAKISGVVVLLAKLEQQRHDVEAEIAAAKRTAVVTDSDRILKAVDTFGELVQGTLDNERRLDIQATLRTLIRRIELRLERNASTISGVCVIFPHVGQEIMFRFAYHPFGNRDSVSILERARWSVM